jgi:hypothetical protein
VGYKVFLHDEEKSKIITEAGYDRHFEPNRCCLLDFSLQILPFLNKSFDMSVAIFFDMPSKSIWTSSSFKP